MAGKRTFVAGEVLTASNINSFLMDQVVPVFDDATARDAAITAPEEGNLAYLKDLDEVQLYRTSWGPLITASGFTASETITVTNASWPVPSLASTIVKVTAVGGGGGGGGVTNLPGAGGTTTFNAGSAGTVTAAGGERGTNTPAGASSDQGRSGTDGLSAGNGGIAGNRNVVPNSETFGGSNGGGGKVTVAYLDLDGISTVNVTIGGGGTGASGGNPTGGQGGDGEVIVEYVAA